MKLKKEQQQIVALGGILVIIVGVLLYFYRDKLLPRAGEGTALPSASPRLTLQPGRGTCQDDKTPCAGDDECKKVSGTAACVDPVYKRQEYRSLKQFGDVPVRPLGGPGSPNPFVSEATAR